tara:strand:+ start:112 stop:309 length:198 start_codon:yes stop_codon:yes gene_type:complete
MVNKEFDELESQVKKLVKLSKQLKESNTYLLEKNADLAIREQELTETLNSSRKKIEKLIHDFKEK